MHAYRLHQGIYPLDENTGLHDICRMKAENKFIRDMGKRIREKREERGWSQERLAIEANIDNSHLGKLERGEGNPTVKLVFRIAQALEIDFQELC